MKKIFKAISIFSTAIVLLSSVVACGKSDNEVSESKNVKFISMSTASYSPDGEYMVNANDGRLCYWDISNNVETIICSDPSCSHELYSETDNPNPECNAVTSDGSIFESAFIYSDKLWYFVNSGLNSTELYMFENNGENKRTVFNELTPKS